MIKANFNTYASYVTDSLHQWDLNQVLQVSGLNLAVVPEVHFSNANTDRAIVRQATMADHVVSVGVPNSLLQDPLRIYAHIGIYEGSTFKVVELVEIPVKPRKRPQDYQIQDADEEIYSFKALENALANRATLVEANALSARIDTIVANANSTDGNSELVDIRVGPDGHQYPSAGAAVRGMHIAKNAQYITHGSIKVDTTAGTITAAEKYAGGGVIYSNESFVWVKDLAATELNYKSVAAAHGSDASWAYVADTVGKTFALRRMGAAPTDAQRIRPTDIIIFFGLCSASGVFSTFVPLINEVYLDGVMQRNALNARWPWNRIVGSLGGKIEIDTAAKTMDINGIFFFESGMWKNLAISLDLTTYALSEDGETVRVTVNKDGKAEINNLETACKIDDLFICEIFASSSWVFDHTRVYTNTATKALTYVDGVVLAPDLRAVGSDVSALKKTIGVGKTTCKIFKRVCCCGDSYTSGHIMAADGTHYGENEEFAWPHYMATATGNEWINCGQSGANALTWQTAGRGLAKAQSAGKVQAYIIGLMINDSSTGANGVDLGTADDIGTDAQTYYGGMSAIIRKLNAISPQAKIFVLTCPRTWSPYPAYNQAVKDIVAAYKNIYPVHCLDLLDYKDMYDTDTLTGDEIGGHFTAIGYEQFAEILTVALSDYINANIVDFQDVAFIEYD